MVPWFGSFLYWEKRKKLQPLLMHPFLTWALTSFTATQTAFLDAKIQAGSRSLTAVTPLRRLPSLRLSGGVCLTNFWDCLCSSGEPHCGRSEISWVLPPHNLHPPRAVSFNPSGRADTSILGQVLGFGQPLAQWVVVFVSNVSFVVWQLFSVWGSAGGILGSYRSADRTFRLPSAGLSSLTIHAIYLTALPV